MPLASVAATHFFAQLNFFGSSEGDHDESNGKEKRGVALRGQAVTPPVKDLAKSRYRDAYMIVVFFMLSVMLGRVLFGSLLAVATFVAGECE